MESGSTWRKFIEEKVFTLAKEQKWEEALQVAYAENNTVYKVIGDFTNYSNEQAKLRDQSIKKLIDLHYKLNMLSSYHLLFALS